MCGFLHFFLSAVVSCPQFSRDIGFFSPLAVKGFDKVKCFCCQFRGSSPLASPVMIVLFSVKRNTNASLSSWQLSSGALNFHVLCLPSSRFQALEFLLLPFTRCFSCLLSPTQVVASFPFSRPCLFPSWSQVKVEAATHVMFFLHHPAGCVTFTKELSTLIASN